MCPTAFHKVPAETPSSTIAAVSRRGISIRPSSSSFADFGLEARIPVPSIPVSARVSAQRRKYRLLPRLINRRAPVSDRTEPQGPDRHDPQTNLPPSAAADLRGILRSRESTSRRTSRRPQRFAHPPRRSRVQNLIRAPEFRLEGNSRAYQGCRLYGGVQAFTTLGSRLGCPRNPPQHHDSHHGQQSNQPNQRQRARRLGQRFLFRASVCTARVRSCCRWLRIRCRLRRRAGILTRVHRRRPGTCRRGK